MWLTLRELAGETLHLQEERAGKARGKFGDSRSPTPAWSRRYIVIRRSRLMRKGRNKRRRKKLAGEEPSLTLV